MFSQQNFLHLVVSMVSKAKIAIRGLMRNPVTAGILGLAHLCKPLLLSCSQGSIDLGQGLVVMLVVVGSHITFDLLEG